MRHWNRLFLAFAALSIACLLRAEEPQATPAKPHAQVWQNKPGGELAYAKGHGLRIVSTGHSWVAPAMRTLDPIARAAGFDGHHLRWHVSGGSTGSARSIWASEKGIDFPGRKPNAPAGPNPVLLPAIATGKWDVMTWGAYPWDTLDDYTQWIDVCLQANPHTIFYVQDGWPLAALGLTAPGEYSADRFLAAQKAINASVQKLIVGLSAKHPGRFHVIPVGDGVCELLKLHLAKQLPYIQAVDSKKQPTPGIYRDGGHLDTNNSGLEWFEGYIYFATLYKKSPESIPAKFAVPDAELDKIYRRVAWQVVTQHPLSGVKDANASGVGAAGQKG